MRRFIAANGVVLALCLAGAPAHAGEWTRLESEHFSVTTNRDGKMVREHLKQLERFRWLALQMMGADDKGLRAQAKFDIVLMSGRSSMKGLFPELDDMVAGQYRHCSEGAAAYAAYEVGQAAWNLMVLQHEYAHHLMFQYATTAYPAWYVEGFAEYMSTFDSTDDVASLGGMNQPRFRTLTRRRSGSWLPLERVLRWGIGAAAEPDQEETESLYAQSWLLTHYMFSNSDRAKKLPAYFARIAAGEDPVASFEPATGIAIAELQRQLKRYTDDGVPMVQLRGGDMPQSTIQAVAFSDAADAYLPTVLPLKACVKTERGQALLGQLRAMTAKPSQADAALRLELARAEARFGDPAAAITLLDELVGADAQHAEALYLLGRAWGRQAQSLQGKEKAEAQEQARNHLFASYRLRKNHAPTLYHLALALAREGASPNAVNASRVARSLSPAVGEYALLESRLDLEVGDRERAARALAPLASDPHNPDVAARMRLAITAIQAGKSAQEVQALMNPEPRKTTP